MHSGHDQIFCSKIISLMRQKFKVFGLKLDQMLLKKLNIIDHCATGYAVSARSGFSDSSPFLLTNRQIQSHLLDYRWALLKPPFGNLFVGRASKKLIASSQDETYWSPCLAAQWSILEPTESLKTKKTNFFLENKSRFCFKKKSLRTFIKEFWVKNECFFFHFSDQLGIKKVCQGSYWYARRNAILRKPTRISANSRPLIWICENSYWSRYVRKQNSTPVQCSANISRPIWICANSHCFAKVRADSH